MHLKKQTTNIEKFLYKLSTLKNKMNISYSYFFIYFYSDLKLISNNNLKIIISNNTISYFINHCYFNNNMFVIIIEII